MRASTPIRTDIQALRAVAVAAVLLYHLWPDAVPGGYVGVDVFFVISGFLITAQLLRGVERDGVVRLGRFWAGRARRLLPLSSLVLLCTVAGVLAVMPASTWIPALRNAMASALYVANWQLADESVDYLARDHVATPTQHFWSLSVEEQFYLGWPILIAGAAVVAVRLAGRGRDDGHRAVRRRAGAFAVVAAVLLASFAWSLWSTSTDPSVAYFSTTTRAWEFAAGGLVAFLPRPAAGAGPLHTPRVVACWLASVSVVAAALLLPAGVPFPGVAALLPVLGAAVFIWVGDVPDAVTPAALGRFRPVAYIGDVSYGIYLWHWPLIVLGPYLLGAELGTAGKLSVLVLSVALAAASKVAVEDPFRFGRYWTGSTRRSFYPGAVGIAAVCAFAMVALVVIQRAPAPVALPLPVVTTSAVSSPTPSAPSDPTVTGAPSAPAPVTPAQTTSQAPVVAGPLSPTIATRGVDNAGMYDCFDFDRSGPHVCSSGPDDATTSIAIVGDSHAAQYIPALAEVAASNGWRLTTITGMSCDGGLGAACAGGEQGFRDVVDGHFDAVLYSAFRASTTAAAEVTHYVTELTRAGVRLLPVADVPFNPKPSFDCIDASPDDAAVASQCRTPLAAALTDVPDRVGPLAATLGLPLIDLTDVFCDDLVCRTVIGNVIVYQDSPSSHLTATMSRLLAPRLDQAITAFLADQRTGGR